MPWESTSSPSFRARHASADADDARRVLRSLEHVRIQLEERFDRLPEPITVVLHSRPTALVLSNPLVGVQRAITEPLGRPLVAGWAGREELHLLSPAAILHARGSRGPIVPGLREMGRLTAATLYARRVPAAPRPARTDGLAPLRLVRELRAAWLVEGVARWLSGQSAHAAPAIARRLRDGGRPAFPPSARDAPLLGATVIELLADARGERAVIELALADDRRGGDGLLERAFGARLVSVEGEWRAWLSELAARDR